jgi:hypothetical protein
VPHEDRPLGLALAHMVLAAAEAGGQAGQIDTGAMTTAIRLEIAIAEAEECSPENVDDHVDPLFRLRAKRWAILDEDLSSLVPVRDPRLRMLTFDAAGLANANGAPAREAGSSIRHIVAFARERSREPLFVSAETARILALCDGTRTAAKVASEAGARHRGTQRRLRQIEELFVLGLLQFRDIGCAAAKPSQTKPHERLS